MKILKRLLQAILFIILILFYMTIGWVMLPFVWILTGRNFEDQIDFYDDLLILIIDL